MRTLRGMAASSAKASCGQELLTDPFLLLLVSRLSSAWKTAVAFGMAVAPRQRAAVQRKRQINPLQMVADATRVLWVCVLWRPHGLGHFARTVRSHSSAINWWPE